MAIQTRFAAVFAGNRESSAGLRQGVLGCYGSWRSKCLVASLYCSRGGERAHR
jgi:hypothetical protein